MNQDEITKMVVQMLDLGYTYKSALIKYLGVSAPTLNSRLKGNSVWRKGEIALITQLKEKFKF